jgi:hypothetical protein
MHHFLGFCTDKPPSFLHTVISGPGGRVRALTARGSIVLAVPSPSSGPAGEGEIIIELSCVFRQIDA